MLARSQVRQRVASFLGLAALSNWAESGQPYDRFMSGADTDFHQRFAVKVNGSTPMAREHQRPEIGMLMRTPVSVRVGFELRSPPHTVEDSDLAEDCVHALMKAISAKRHSPDLELVHVSIDPPTIDPEEGRWWLGGFQLFAAHRLALE